MKIVYDTKEDMYLVKIEQDEDTFYFNTNNITEVKTEFVKFMERLFDYAICDKLKGEEE